MISSTKPKKIENIAVTLLLDRLTRTCSLWHSHIINNYITTISHKSTPTKLLTPYYGSHKIISLAP